MPHLSPMMWTILPLMLFIFILIIMCNMFFMNSLKFPTLIKNVNFLTPYMWKW